MCVLATQQCDYLADCPLGEDEEGCGELTDGRTDEWMDGWTCIAVKLTLQQCSCTTRQHLVSAPIF